MSKLLKELAQKYSDAYCSYQADRSLCCRPADREISGIVLVWGQMGFCEVKAGDTERAGWGMRCCKQVIVVFKTLWTTSTHRKIAEMNKGFQGNRKSEETASSYGDKI